MKGPLYLSRIQDNTTVSVASQIVEHLLPYQIAGVRFLYQQCILKKHNVILNNEKGMNEARQISALLTAIYKPSQTLIVCQSCSIAKWHYEFSKSNLKIVTADELIKQDDETDLPDAVILTHEQVKHIKVLPITEWLFYIIEDIELVIKSRLIKNIDAQFRIAITTCNFMVNQDSSVQWDILKWTNPDFIEDKDTFIKTNEFNKKNLLYPYPEYWHRITWIIYEKYKTTDKEMQEYDATIHDWLKRMSIKLPAVSNKTNSRQSKKRKSNQQSKSNKKKVLNEENSKSPISKSTPNKVSTKQIFSKTEHSSAKNIESQVKKLEISEKSSGSETEEETDLLNSFFSKKPSKYSKEIVEKYIKSDVDEVQTDSDEENDFKFTIN